MNERVGGNTKFYIELKLYKMQKSYTIYKSMPNGHISNLWPNGITKGIPRPIGS